MFGNQLNRPSMRYIVNFNTTDYEPHDRIPELWENETIDFILDQVEFSFTNDIQRTQGTGKLYITSKRVLWIHPDKAFDFDVPYIILHAVSKDPSTYPKPCVYCQTDVEEEYAMNLEQQEEDDHSKEEEGGAGEEEGNKDEIITEFFLAPEEEKDLSAIFDALSHAAMLNPDPDDQEEGEDGDDDFIFNADEVILGAEQARRLDHLESVFQFPDEPEQPNKKQKNNNNSEGSSNDDHSPMDS